MFRRLLPLLVCMGGCISEKESDLIKFHCEDSGLSLTLVSVTEADCTTGGVAVFSGDGGTGPYTFSINGGSPRSSDTFSDLASGTYEATIFDVNTCSVTIQITVPSAPNSVQATASSEVAGCGGSGGAIKVRPIGGVRPYQFKIEDGSFQADSIFNSLQSGTYTVTVQDSESCKTHIDVKVETGVSLDSEVFPIITQNCAVTGCHLDTQVPFFTSKSEVIKNSSNIRNLTSAKQMPPPGEGDLTQAEINLIKCWVGDGAKDN